MTEIEQLERAIAALEAQRAVLGDDVVDAALAPMCEKLAALKTHPAPTEPQRKQATVLFADVAGFTAMSETMDAEDMTEMMNAIWQRLDAVIASHGGRIDKHIGDAVMAVWGANQALEIDPEQAIRAALGMQAELRLFQETNGAPLAMRIGINTGPVFLSEVGTTLEFTAMGDTVNLASRLEHAAPVSGILISHDTYRQVRGVFDVQVLEPLTVKGKSEPVQAYVVERAKPRAFRLSSRGVEGVETRMIGREAELKRLQDALRRVSDERRPRAVTVVGEAGVGKSRLLYEFSAWVDLLPETYRVFKGRAGAETGKLPYALLRDVFAFRFEIQDSDPPDVARDKVEQGIAGFLGADPNALEKAHFIGHLIGLDFSASPHLRGVREDPKQIHDRAFHYLSQLFAAAAGEGSQAGAILLLEDIHWADDGSLDAVAHVMEACRTVPLLVLCLARPALYEWRPDWDRDIESHACLDLCPLSGAECDELVDEILQKLPEIPPALRRILVSRAEGNPFYAEELVKMLIDGKVIEPGPDEWRVEEKRLADVDVPPTLTGVLQARLDGLPRPEHATLQHASVIGRVFWDEAVEVLELEAANQSAATKDAVRNRLRLLGAKELIYELRDSTFAGADEYAFKHALLRDVSYESLLKRQRRICHAQAARWLAARSGARADVYAGLIAEHFERAGEALEAAEWYGRAGKQAREAYAPNLAIDYYQKALELSQRSGRAPGPSELDWYEGLGEALWARAQLADAAEAYIAMQATAEAMGDLISEARAWNALGLVQQLQGDHHAELESEERADAAAQAAIALGGGEPARIEQLNALQQKGWTLCSLQDTDGALRAGERALALTAELSDSFAARRLRAYCLNLLSITQLHLSNFDQAERFAGETLTLHRQMGNRRDVAIALVNWGVIAWRQGDFDNATARYEEALEIAREIGHRSLEITCINNLAEVHVARGAFATAEAELREVIAALGTKGSYFTSESHMNLAEACLGLGKAAEAVDAAQSALALARENGNPEGVGCAWRTLGNCGLLLDDLGATLSYLQPIIDGPQSCFRESLRILGEVGDEAELARTMRAWARYELTKGDEEKGKAMWREARDTFARLDLPLEVARMEHEG